MKNKILVGSKTIELEDMRMMSLEYYLLEHVSEENKEKALYGVKITKKIDDYMESEEVDAISYSKEFVEQMIKQLMDNDVTPISMIEIIDEMITVRLCS
ncbi:DUF6514 family protein [Anaeromicropila herbilytica]|uniref:Uncharacterized protein n=1 Tax=Anaeromicropila herbilytica TaxID=2785025 RepID=A0A7R7EJR7_9FIRM|nr:DUF6514 family protein [Anaeromicropila herbilytica]BCN30039.1 hypothetical protein bsdtb5_13340 [Anaeromicropila herbilytica]